ncbi:aldehyde dehydrogenase family protein [Mesorhizobium sp. AD1-1]|uniref:aldehyde dehydrogenase family protein n=1 Tax=Mesorhizobium sp. AD1-1 TaxID=2876621 RepID=UPI001CCDF12B|nr:aldehyde dehydrogenase family protein [Mesorhizobium sp. AD1-1]MBZ9722248.1 aldehyde dehydrogenase family protein [Mesorhizobium sp. AD1-1]
MRSIRLTGPVVFQSGNAEAFSAGLAERLKSMKVGDGYDPKSQCGPLINRKAVDRLTQLVTDATARGAKVLVGGGPIERQGYFFAPTVLTGVSPDSGISAEDIFGPIAALTTFETEDEVIELAATAPSLSLTRLIINSALPQLVA